MNISLCVVVRKVKKNNNRTSKKVLSIALALMLTLGVFAAMPMSVFAAVPDIEMKAGTPTLTVTDASNVGSIIGFAGQEWYVIGDGTSGVNPVANSVTLLVKSTGDPYGNSAYNATTDTSKYENGQLHTSMTGLYTSIGTANSKEQVLITARTIDDIWDGTGSVNANGTLTGQHLWPLSSAEWTTIGNSTVRSYGGNWWLRSPSAQADAYVALGDGSGTGTGLVYGVGRAVRPALNLNLSSVLFTSAAVYGKEDSVDAYLSEVTAPTGAIKLTVKDDTNLSLTLTDTAPRSTWLGGTVDVSYTAAGTAAANRFVSCVIEQSGVVKYYGKLATAVATGGVASIDIPFTMPAGTYTLKMFNEEINGDNLTDFASTPVSIDLTVTVPIQYSVISDFPTVTDKSAFDIEAEIDADHDQFFNIGTLTLLGSVENATKGETLAPTTHYTHSSGSTIITLTPAYLNTLANGTYLMLVHFAGGNAALLSLVVAVPGAGSGTSATGNPKTGDDTPWGLLITLMAIAGAGVALGIRRRFARN